MATKRQLDSPLHENSFLSKPPKVKNEFILTKESNNNKVDRTNQSISNDLRKRIVDSIAKGICTRKTAAITFDIPYSTVLNIYSRYLKDGSTEKKKRETYKPKKLNDEQIQFLVDSMAEKCTYTLKDLQNKLIDSYNTHASISLITRCLKSFHFNVKRTGIVPESVLPQEKIQELQLFCERFLEHLKNERILIFVSNTEFQVTMRRLSGRYHDGHGDKMVVPSLRIRNRTVSAAMTMNELIYYRGQDPIGNDVTLLTFMKDMLAELLTRGINGAVIMIDETLVSTWQDDIAQCICMNGHELLLIPASGGCFNAVEYFFSEWESHLRARNPSKEVELEELISTYSGLLDAGKCQTYWQRAMDSVKNCVSDHLDYVEVVA